MKKNHLQVAGMCIAFCFTKQELGLPTLSPASLCITVALAVLSAAGSAAPRRSQIHTI